MMKGVASIFKELSIGKNDSKVETEVISTSLDFKFEFENDPSSTVEAKKKKNKKKKKKTGDAPGAEKDIGDDDVEETNKVDDSFSEFDAKSNVQYLNELVNDDTQSTDKPKVDSKPVAAQSVSNAQKKNSKKGANGNVQTNNNTVTPAQKNDANNKTAKKGKGKSKAGSTAMDDDEFDAFLNECQAQNEKDNAAAAKQAKLDKKNNKDKAKPPPKDIPRFLSSKDPELDEASKLKAKYGNGKNLVAIGPRKVRDPNWSAAAAVAAPGAMAPVPAASAVADEAPPSGTSSAGLTHSSVFSFSFDGL